jgi:tol-pal system protein YbgF
MKLLIAGLLVVTAAGPAYPQSKEIYQLQRDVLDVQQRLKQIQTTVDQDDAVLKGLAEKTADQVNMLAGSIAKLSQAADALKTQNDATMRVLTTLNATVKELEEGMSSLRAQVNSVTRELTNLKTTAEPLATPNDLWRTAYVDYSAGNYDLAISGLQEFLSKYPNDARAPEAHLMMGAALAAQKKAELAITEYDIVLQKYPESDTTRTALLKKGLALAEANQPQQAIATLNEVVKKFPGTSEANTAQAKLREIQPAQRRTTPARE